MMTSPFEFSIFFGNLNHILSRESLIKNALQTEDIAGSVLRIHLSCEQILTAWIYAACGREDFLQGTQLTFGVKLTIAENLDLPEYSQYALFLIRRWLALPYHLYCLRLAALYEK